MSCRRALTAALTAAALLVPAGAARAGFFTQVLDGPSADVQRLGDVSIARDAVGVAVYVRRDGGVDHVFAAPFANGQFGAPARVDTGLAGPSSQPVVATAEGGRAAIAFVNGGSLYGVVRPAGAAGFGAPTQLDAGGPVADPDIDMSVNGVAYVVYTGPGPGGRDVRGVRLDKATGWAALPAALDIDPAHDAGDGAANRPRVAVAADNTALAVWSEAGSVVARRLFGTNLSAAPQQASVPSFAGQPGGAADSPDVAIEYDSSFAWVVFRQAFGAHTRVLARRLAGSAFGDPVAVDGLSDGPTEGAGAPAIAMNGTGAGLAVSGRDASHITVGAVLDLDKWDGGNRVDSLGSASLPPGVVTLGQNFDGVVAWVRDAGSGADEVRARPFTPMPNTFAPEAVASAPDLGPVEPSLGFEAAADRAGNTAILFLQGTPGAQRLVAGLYDRPPGRALGVTTLHWRRSSRPGLRWRPSAELWGPVSYQVLVDGEPVGSPTQGDTLTPPTALPDGSHHWQIAATDIRGQTSVSRPRLLRIDDTAPRLNVKVLGARRAGKTLRVRVRASDAHGSGVTTVHVTFGDGSRTVTARSARHRYFRGGRFTLKVASRDRAGNLAILRRHLRIKR